MVLFHSNCTFALLLIIITLLFLSIQCAENERGFLDFLFSPCKCKCGVPNRESRLIGGEPIKTHEFPWITFIQIQNKQNVPATLINNKYVLTAASNLIGLTPYDIKITLGQYDKCFPDVSSTNVSADKIIIHPDFSRDNRANDLALVKLSNIINLERRISPICLATPNTNYLGQVATVTGWTHEKHEANQTCRPKKLGLPVLGTGECLKSSMDNKFMSRDKNCVGIVGVPSVICTEDAGGAVMFRSHGGIYELIGILTDKNECNSTPSTAMYTSVNEHLLWLTENTRDACYCIKANY